MAIGSCSHPESSKLLCPISYLTADFHQPWNTVYLYKQLLLYCYKEFLDNLIWFLVLARMFPPFIAATVTFNLLNSTDYDVCKSALR